MTKVFLNKINKWLLAVPLCLLMVAVSCNSEEEVVPQTDYSGEEIFRALFFLNGPLTNQMEVLKPGAQQLQAGMDETHQIEYRDFMGEIISHVKELDPNYFTEFKKHMQSDNLYEMELALINAQSMFEAAGKRSSYAEHFNLLSEIKDKKVDLSDDKFKNLDLSKPEDAETFAKIFKEDYDIDLEGVQSSVGRGHCIAVFVVAFVAGNIVYVVNVAGAWNVAMAANWTKTTNYQIPRFDSNDATLKALVSELAAVIN